MVRAGDELGRTQTVNNNAYCQDNETSWIDWARADEDLASFVASLIAFRKAHPVLRRRRFLRGTPQADGLPDAQWLRADGAVMGSADWEDPVNRSVGLFLNGAAIDERAPDGAPLVDDDVVLLFNAGEENLDWVLPAELGDGWVAALGSADTMAPPPVPEVPACSLAVWLRPREA